MAGEATRFAPGQIGNPEGRNQYTYRRDFELAIADLLKGVFEFRRELVPDHEGAKARCLICNALQCTLYVGQNMYAHAGCIDQIGELTRGQVIALITVQRAMAGDEKMLPTVLDRLWPKVDRHEIEVIEAAPAEALISRLDSIAKRKKASGDNRKSRRSRANGSGKPAA